MHLCYITSLDPFCGSFAEFDADFLDFFHKTQSRLKALVSSSPGTPGKSGSLTPATDSY